LITHIDLHVLCAEECNVYPMFNFDMVKTSWRIFWHDTSVKSKKAS
jgi:hypothetical protein